MRVLVAASRFPPRPEAAGPRAALDLCLALARHTDVTVLAPASPGAPPRERWDALEVRRAARITPRALRRAVRGHDLVHALGLLPLGLTAAWSRGRPRRFALVTTLARRDAFTLPRLPAARALSRWFAARADAVIAPASNVREAFERVLGTSTPTRVVPPGVDVAYFRAAPEPAADSPFPGGFVLFAGRLAVRDGLDVLLRALPRVRERHPGLGLVALGDGPLANDLRALAAELGLAEWVRFPGLVDRARVAAYLHACRAACLPSTVDACGEAEAVPCFALEALAAGVRVVATDAGGVPDSIEPGRNGWLALAGDPGDLAARLLDAFDAPLPTGVVASAEAHDWARVAAQHVEVYERALRG